MAEASSEKANLIGYFAYAREVSTAWGALVLVTLEGDPVDFFYTEPVTLNPVTHRLFGARIDGFLAGRVLLEPLLEQAAGRMALLCMDEPVVLHRRFAHSVPVAVLAAADAPHKAGAWTAERGPAGNGHAESWWVTAENAATAMATLHAAAAAMAPYGILEPFQQLRAAMAEVRGERA